MTVLEEEDIRSVAELDFGWDKLNNKTVLLSGGTGFIGQFVIDVFKYRNQHYDANIKVISLSRHDRQSEENVTYLKCDVTQKINLTARIDYILHLASNTHPMQYTADPVGTITTNILGCLNLLQIAERDKARFLLASSVEIYGDGNGDAMDERFCGYLDCNTARAGYNEAKRVSESLCQSFRAQYGVECVIVRLSRCFGADRKEDSKALAQFIGNAVRGEDIVLKSKGEQRFSYCYVADAASGILKVLLDGKDGEAYNVAEDDERKTLGDYAGLIASYAGRKVVFDCVGQSGASKANFALIDCGKLKALGWQPIYRPSEAMRRTVDILKQIRT